ncbi:class I SAM-dependent methyltransferase [Nakamurella lactea]|uniref:class I SAM-dependent methyltransferase n=1 Tax=Nakamurella lactea TaxID=459515 RepID=UPI0004278A50|nr:class I SAM-dependent methyltransferase [Nakamurella lactea]
MTMADAGTFDARAAQWQEWWSSLADPARHVLLSLAKVGPGTRLLDVGCGSGELAAMAADLGADVSGVDASDNMVLIAGNTVPRADIRQGSSERLPWPDDSFDVVTAVNSFQFSDDVTVPVTEAVRVLAPGGVLAVCNWAEREHQQVREVDDAVAGLGPERAGPSVRDPDVRSAGVLEELLEGAGLRVTAAGEVPVPYELADERELLQAFAFELPDVLPEHVTDQLVATTVERAAAPYRLDDGSYRFENIFRYVLATAPRRAAGRGAAGRA